MRNRASSSSGTGEAPTRRPRPSKRTCSPPSTRSTRTSRSRSSLSPSTSYYTLLGTAIESGTGPDLALFNGGTQLKSRTDLLTPVTEELADLEETLAGWPAFQADGETYSAPMFLQGFPIYYNKAVFEAAGLDPDNPPTTWEDLTAACEAILAETDKSCFALGNKEGLGIEFFLSGFASGALHPRGVRRLDRRRARLDERACDTGASAVAGHLRRRLVQRRRELDGDVQRLVRPVLGRRGRHGHRAHERDRALEAVR